MYPSCTSIVSYRFDILSIQQHSLDVLVDISADISDIRRKVPRRRDALETRSVTVTE